MGEYQINDDITNVNPTADQWKTTGELNNTSIDLEEAHLIENYLEQHEGNYPDADGGGNYFPIPGTRQGDMKLSIAEWDKYVSDLKRR